LDRIQEHIPGITESIIGTVIILSVTKLLSISRNRVTLISKRRAEKQYREFLEVLSNRETLIVLFLEGIARSIYLLAVWAFYIILLSFFGFDFPSVFVPGLVVSLLIGYYVSKPINILYAIRNSEKYKTRMRKKLGRLPDDSG
jgi:hypothetical protein